MHRIQQIVFFLLFLLVIICDYQMQQIYQMNRIHQNDNQKLIIDNKAQNHTNLNSPKNNSALLMDPFNDKKEIKKNKKSDYSDYYNAIQLASFIGLERKKVANIKLQTKQQRFLKIHNFHEDIDGQKGNKIIKNDILNRNINFFDLKKLWQNRSSKIKYQTSKMNSQKNIQKNKQNYEIKQKRIMSAKINYPSSNNSTLQNLTLISESDPNIMRLRAHTARQIDQHKRKKIREQIKAQKIVCDYFHQKLIRSQILGNISRDTTLDIRQDSRQIDYERRWRKAQQKSINQKGNSSPSKIQNISYRSQMIKSVSTKGSPSGELSPSYLENGQIIKLNPQSPKQFNYSGIKIKKNHKRSQSCVYSSQIHSNQRKNINSKNQVKKIKLNFKNQQNVSNVQNQINKSKYVLAQDENNKGQNKQKGHSLQNKFLQNSFINQANKRIKLRSSNKIRLKLNKRTNHFQFALK